MNFFGIGGLEMLVIALVAFLVLGPRKMADAGKSAAKILSELRKQRDELTAAIMAEPSDQEEPKHAKESARAVPHDQANSGESSRPGAPGSGQDASATSERPPDRQDR
ncbi:MAG: twin-arginine translocase TatA/TatE family subunit [Chloroflexi bacterium]|nr:twin-arginine translocase TatA/TatE family subunit [Chloroflexota bacterium]